MPKPTPRFSPRIHFHYKVRGRQLKPEAVARAIELSKDKYCSASIMIGKTALITYDFEIIEDVKTRPAQVSTIRFDRQFRSLPGEASLMAALTGAGRSAAPR